MVCVFVNLKQDTIVVEKQTVGGDGELRVQRGDLGSFDLTTVNGAASQSFRRPDAGNLQHQRDGAGGLGADGCDLRQRRDAGQRQPGAGGDGTCTFENTKLGSLTVAKVALGVRRDLQLQQRHARPGELRHCDDEWRGRARLRDLLPGTYDVTETAQAGWDEFFAVCD